MLSPPDKPDEIDPTIDPTSLPRLIPKRGHSSANGTTNSEPLLAHQRIPTASEDDHLSSSRSRRLVSGYRFGNPPSPGETRHSSPIRHPTPPPHHENDSPPLIDTSPELETDGPTPRPNHDSVEDLQEIASMALADANGLSKRRSSISRDRDTGYDALNGLNDGEADLDESAPQAAFGTEAYMKGVDGEAGQYYFPRHRLRKTMKGELVMFDATGADQDSDETKIPLVIGE